VDSYQNIKFKEKKTELNHNKPQNDNTRDNNKRKRISTGTSINNTNNDSKKLQTSK